MAHYLADNRSARCIARLGAVMMSGPAWLTRWLLTLSALPAETPLYSEAIESLVRENVNAGGRPASTCRLGAVTDEDAVVDSACRMIGVEGLRVLDASIFPMLMTPGTKYSGYHGGHGT